MSETFVNGDARDRHLDALWREADEWAYNHVDILSDDLCDAVDNRDIKGFIAAFNKLARVLTAVKDLAEEIAEIEGFIAPQDDEDEDEEDYDDEEE